MAARVTLHQITIIRVVIFAEIGDILLVSVHKTDQEEGPSTVKEISIVGEEVMALRPTAPKVKISLDQTPKMVKAMGTKVTTLVKTPREVGDFHAAIIFRIILDVDSIEADLTPTEGNMEVHQTIIILDLSPTGVTLP